MTRAATRPPPVCASPPRPRARRARLGRIASDDEQPFGSFSGELPGTGRLREGWGVMERHAARW